MCYKVECKQCMKWGWGGCGKHLVPLHKSIENGSHCICRSWPGVVAIQKENKPDAAAAAAAATANSTPALDTAGEGRAKVISNTGDH
ncbi:hypothetical protein LINPERPRIM_LOCUS7704 [Linum perenne]